MKTSLQSQWLMAFTAVALGLVTLVTVLAWWAAYHQTKLQVENRLRTIAVRLARPSYRLTPSVLEMISALTDAELVLMDNDGRVVQASNNSKADLSEISLPSDLSPRDSPTIEYDLNVPNAGLFHSAWVRFTPIDPRSNPPDARWLGILVSDQSVRQMQRQAFFLPLLTGCAIAIALGCVASVLFSRIVRRLSTVQQQVSRIASGAFDEIPLQGSNDELGQLAVSVNTLAAELRSFESKIQIAERDRLVHQTADGLAHDLRNTLTGARLAIQWHSKTCRTGDAEAIAIATRQLSLAEDQIQRWMRVGEHPIKMIAAPLGTAIDGALAMAAPTAEHLRVHLELRRHAKADLEIVQDQQSVMSAILNLLLNAIQAAGSGGTVFLDTMTDPSTVPVQVEIQVSDNGPGPPPELAASIFEPLVTGKREGVGMGLALVARTAKQLGGKVNWSREANQTVFTLQLPVVAKDSM